MKNIVILSLSDLHIRGGNSDPFDLISCKFKEFIKTKLNDPKEAEWKPDFLCITGDIAHKAKPEQYEIAKNFINELCNLWKIPKENVLMAPGNHDMFFNVTPVKPPQIHLKDGGVSITLLEGYSNYCNYLEKYFNQLEKILPKKRETIATYKEENFSTIVEIFENYCKFRQEFIQSASLDCEYIHSDLFREAEKLKNIMGCVKFPKRRIAFIEFNNTWNSVPEDTLSFRRFQLQFGVDIVKDIEKKIDKLKKDNYIIISLFHHPIYNLSEQEYQSSGSNPCVYDLIIEMSDICLSGHQHGPKAKKPDRLANKTQYFLNGAFNDKNEYANDCSASLLRINRVENTVEERYITQDSDQKWCLGVVDSNIYPLCRRIKSHKDREDELSSTEVSHKLHNQDNILFNNIVTSYFGERFNLINSDEGKNEGVSVRKLQYGDENELVGTILFVELSSYSKKQIILIKKVIEHDGTIPIPIGVYADQNIRRTEFGDKNEENSPPEYNRLAEELNTHILKGEVLLFLVKTNIV
ncbi:MAG: metallophosphoesterase [Tannerellaceae bacterium]|jgi:predicted MPP superfamily phosphohydrolase|nr:metallophosphoesterase [Tannerellaceae bacterium]